MRKMTIEEAKKIEECLIAYKYGQGGADVFMRALIGRGEYYLVSRPVPEGQRIYRSVVQGHSKKWDDWTYRWVWEDSLRTPTGYEKVMIE